MKARKLFPYATSLALAAATLPTGAAQVRLHGATPVIDRLIYPNKDAVEKSTGRTLKLVGSATGKGLVDLHEGRCDASLSSEPIAIAVIEAAAAGKQIDPTKLQFEVVTHDEIVFIVHPSNPVTSLTWDQIRDIQTGRIANWKEVGGNDQPITVFADTPAGGTRAMIQALVMGGEEFSPKAVSVSAVSYTHLTLPTIYSV